MALMAAIAPAVTAHEFAGRFAMGFSMAFHIVFACVGVALPLFIVTAHGLWIKTSDPTWGSLARRWSKALGVTFAVGAVSGTVLSFDLGLLWPKFMGFSGSVIGLPFAFEGFSFLIEAIFVGLYLYGWKRFSPRAHFLTGIPLVVTGVVGTAAIVSVNRWMNVPTGFDIVDGAPANIDPLAAVFGPTWWTKVPHMILAAYLAVAFSIAAVYATGILRGRRDRYHRAALGLALSVGAIAAPLQFGVGDLLARDVAQHQPAKTAAIEALQESTAGAPMNLIGLPIPGSDGTFLNVGVPKLLSLLAFDDPNALVRGYRSFPVADRPNIPMTRWPWLAMIGVGTFLVLLSVAIFLARRVLGRFPLDRWTLRAIQASGPLAFVAVECGWFVTEFGRQPWIVYGIMRTDDAVTTSPLLPLTAVAVFALYVLLGGLTVWLLRRMATGLPEALPGAGRGAGVNGGASST